MDGCKKSAPEHRKALRNHCCTSLSRFFTGHFRPLTGRLTARGRHHLGGRNNVRSVPQYRQAGQQKSGIEIAAIDAPIDGRPIPPDTHRIQGFGQLAVAPVTLLHPSFNQQFRLEAPLVHYLRLRFYQSGVVINRQRTSFTYTHFRRCDFQGDRGGQLESILSHATSSYLYLSPNYFEVRVNA